MAKPVVKEVLMSIFSALSMPLSICSGGACTSIYISTVTSILSSFSLPLTLVVPILNYLGFAMQLVGLVSIYSANKWRSLAFWLYIVGMLLMAFLGGWIGCILIIIAVVLNAKTNKFVYGKKLFKETILWSLYFIWTDFSSSLYLYFAHYSIQIIKTHNEPTELVQAKDPQSFAEEEHTTCGQPQM